MDVGKDKGKDVVVKVMVVLGPRHARAMVRAAPVLLLASLLFAHLHHTVPVDTIAKKCIRQYAESGN
ncbi:hypothetical protein NTGBS_30044 [Candidatus Nitrotoga sp. BS]|nr:hypothetical protein NTGBS_30044 [Candidatus Nitrotoga sp. BS]